MCGAGRGQMVASLDKDWLCGRPRCHAAHVPACSGARGSRRQVILLRRRALGVRAAHHSVAKRLPAITAFQVELVQNVVAQHRHAAGDAGSRGIQPAGEGAQQRSKGLLQTLHLQRWCVVRRSTGLGGGGGFAAGPPAAAAAVHDRL